MAKLSATILVSVLAVLGIFYFAIDLNWLDAKRLGLVPPILALVIAAEIAIFLLRKRRKL
jgi:hypothetical protein